MAKISGSFISHHGTWQRTPPFVLTPGQIYLLILVIYLFLYFSNYLLIFTYIEANSNSTK